MDDINPDDLISQLKSLPTDSKKLERAAAEHPEIKKEDLEEFVIKQSSKLIQDSLEMIDNMKEVVHHLPEAENMSALSELVKASSDQHHALTMSREEIMAKLLSDSKNVINVDAEVNPTEQLTKEQP